MMGWRDIQGWLNEEEGEALGRSIAVLKQKYKSLMILEAGSFRGRSTVCMLERMADGDTLASFDPLYSYDDWCGDENNKYLMDNIADFLANRVILKRPSWYFFRTRFPSPGVYMQIIENKTQPHAIFIDSFHDYQTTIDIATSALALGCRNFLFHDYSTTYPGVIEAVDKFYALLPGYKKVLNGSLAQVIEQDFGKVEWLKA